MFNILCEYSISKILLDSK